MWRIGTAGRNRRNKKLIPTGLQDKQLRLSVSARRQHIKGKTKTNRKAESTYKQLRRIARRGKTCTKNRAPLSTSTTKSSAPTRLRYDETSVKRTPECRCDECATWATASCCSSDTCSSSSMPTGIDENIKWKWMKIRKTRMPSATCETRAHSCWCAVWLWGPPSSLPRRY